jgi:hypothetical protein
MTRIRDNLAIAIALTALFVALGGSAYAVSKGGVTTKHVKDNSLKGKDIRNDSLTGADVNESTLNIAPPAPVGPGGGPPVGPAGGALSGTYPNPSLAANSILSVNVAQSALLADDLAPGSVGDSEISSSAVGTPEIATDGVDQAEIANSSVTDDELATDSIDSNEIKNGSLNGDDVGHDSGTVSNFDIPVLDPAGDLFSCTTVEVDAGVPTDMRNDVISVTATGLNAFSLRPGPATVAGRFRVEACNLSPFVQNPPSSTLHWIAFDV